jgi:hypothetical protein
MRQPDTLPEYPKPISFSSTYKRGDPEYSWGKDWWWYSAFWTILGFIAFGMQLKGM